MMLYINTVVLYTTVTSFLDILLLLYSCNFDVFSSLDSTFGPKIGIVPLLMSKRPRVLIALKTIKSTFEKLIAGAKHNLLEGQ